MYDKHVHDSVSIAVLKIRVSSLGDEEAHTFLLPQTGSEGQRVLPQVHVPLKTLYWYTGASDIHVSKHILIYRCLWYTCLKTSYWYTLYCQFDMMVSYSTLWCPLNYKKMKLFSNHNQDIKFYVVHEDKHVLLPSHVCLLLLLIIL